MSLLGAPLLWLLGALTVAVPVGTYLLWSRVRGPRPVRVLQRGLSILAAQLVALCLTAVAVNDYSSFYGSWPELGAGLRQLAGAGSVSAASDGRLAAGAHSGQAVAPDNRTKAGLPRRTVYSAGSVSIHSYPGYTDPRQWRSRGRLESVTIRGGISRLSSPGYVYLPPQYFQPAYAKSWFPGVEAMTGYPGDAANLISRMQYQKVLPRLIAEHRVRPMVLVLLRPSVTFPWDTECTNVPAGPQAQTFFAADVPAQISAHYRVLPTGWGAIGSSTGGYCVTKLAMLHPGEFRAAVSLSGYYFALQDQTTGNLWGGSRVVRDLNNLHWRLRHLPAPAVSVLVCSSPGEYKQGGYRQARKFLAQVRPPMRAQLLSVPHGGHNFTTWHDELPTALPWLSRRLTGPGPAPQYSGSARLATSASRRGR